MDDAGEDRPRPREVRRTYDRIGTHFSKTRANPWPEVETFVERVAATGDLGGTAVGLDVGCGNGRHAAVLSTVVERVLALDASRTLLAAARERVAAGDPSIRPLQGDAARLPLATDSVDLAVYVATLHHLPGRDRRVTSLDEFARVLGAGGRGLVSAWATSHDRFDVTDAEQGFDTTVDWTLPGGEVVDRFYHIYALPEFRRDLADSDLVVERAWASSGNCYARVRGRP